MRVFKPQDKPLVSVIIPIYNVEKYVAQCLDSIISQSYTNLEIICVNDGSTDSSGEIVQEYAQRDCRICYFEQENQGLGGARNKGLDEAQGEYIYFIDSDDYIDSGYIEGLVNKCNVGITPIQTKMFFVRGDKLEIYNLHLGKKGNFMLNPSLMPFLSFHIVNVLLQAAIIKTYHIRFLLSQGAEDSEFFYRYIIFAPNICFIDTGAYYYRQRQDSILDLFRNSGNFPLEPLESFKTIYSWYKQYEVLEKYGLPFKLLYSFDLHSKNAENYYESAKNLVLKLKIPQSIIKRDSQMKLMCDNDFLMFVCKSKYVFKTLERSFRIRLFKEYSVIRLFGRTFYEHFRILKE